MAEQPGERGVTAKVGEELIGLMVPDVDPELVQVMLSCARSAACCRDDGESRPDGEGKPPPGLLQEYAELLALIRDARIDRVRLRAILGLHPEALPTDGDSPRPPAP